MRRSFTILSLLFLAACSKDPAPPPVADENSAIDTITQQALQDHLDYLANDDERPTWNEGDFFGEKFGR